MEIRPRPDKQGIRGQAVKIRPAAAAPGVQISVGIVVEPANDGPRGGNIQVVVIGDRVRWQLAGIMLPIHCEAGATIARHQDVVAELVLLPRLILLVSLIAQMDLQAVSKERVVDYLVGRTRAIEPQTTRAIPVDQIIAKGVFVRSIENQDSDLVVGDGVTPILAVRATLDVDAWCVCIPSAAYDTVTDGHEIGPRYMHTALTTASLQNQTLESGEGG